MRQKIGKVCMILGALLILASAALLAYNKWDASRADKAAQQALGEPSRGSHETSTCFRRCLFLIFAVRRVVLLCSDIRLRRVIFALRLYLSIIFAHIFNFSTYPHHTTLLHHFIYGDTYKL